MAIIQNGSFKVISGGNAQTLNLGFIPTRFTMWNQTLTTATPSAGIVQALWFPTLAAGTAIIDTSTVTTGAIARSLLATNGITPFQTVPGTEWVPLTGLPPGATSTALTITGISKAVNASITATHAFTASDVGVTTVTFSGVQGMIQMNTLRGVIQSVTSTTSFTVNIDSTTFSTYTSGGEANIITGVPAFTTQGFQIFNTPQKNVSFVGLTLGSSLMVNTNNLWYYEAVLDAPFTSA